jgi:glycerol dehydrogenase-like iron-containing ADH family enzyme
MYAEVNGSGEFVFKTSLDAASKRGDCRRRRHRTCHEVSRRLGFTESALIITGSKTYEVAGKTVCEHLERGGIEAEILVVESATLKDVERPLKRKLRL